MNDELEIGQDEENDDIAAKLGKLKEKLEACRKEKQEYLTGWQRCQADFINYRRRQEEGAAELIKLSCAGIIKDVLPALDSIEAAQIKCRDDQGLALLKNQLWDILQKHGLQEIAAIGEKFNPELHEAVEQVESDNQESGSILEVAQKGYLLNGRVLRIAKVRVIK